MRKGKPRRAVSLTEIMKLVHEQDQLGIAMLRDKIAPRVRRYPPEEYTFDGVWRDDDIEQIANSIIEVLLHRGLDRAWYLSGAGDKRISSNLNQLIFNAVLKNAPPEHQAFYSQVVDHFRRHRERFAKKTLNNRTYYMGLAAWKGTARGDCSKDRKELYNIWYRQIKWPIMADGKSIKAHVRRELFYLMLDIIDEWVLDADFYHNFRVLVHFPKPGSGYFDAPPSGSDDDDESGPQNANQPRNFYKLFKKYFQSRPAQHRIQNPDDSWSSCLEEIIKNYNTGARGFLYYFCIEDQNQTISARKAGRSVGFGCETRKRFINDLMKLQIDIKQLPDVHKYLAALLFNSLKPEAEA